MREKKRKINLYVILACSFFTFFYPELIRKTGTVTVLQEEDNEDVFAGLLKAKPGEVCIKSRIYEWVKSLLDTEEKHGESGNFNHYRVG